MRTGTVVAVGADRFSIVILAVPLGSSSRKSRKTDGYNPTAAVGG
jgi:hypothetical protein